jgi:hypothetical protein
MSFHVLFQAQISFRLVGTDSARLRGLARVSTHVGTQVPALSCGKFAEGAFEGFPPVWIFM